MATQITLNTTQIDVLNKMIGTDTFDSKGKVKISFGTAGDETVEIFSGETTDTYTITTLSPEQIASSIHCKPFAAQGCVAGGENAFAPADPDGLRNFIVALNSSEIRGGHKSLLDSSAVLEMKKMLGVL